MNLSPVVDAEAYLFAFVWTRALCNTLQPYSLPSVYTPPLRSCTPPFIPPQGKVTRDGLGSATTLHKDNTVGLHCVWPCVLLSHFRLPSCLILLAWMFSITCHSCYLFGQPIMRKIITFYFFYIFYLIYFYFISCIGLASYHISRIGILKGKFTQE